MIERELLVEMFEQMQEDGLDTDQNLLWGYFFNDKDQEKLEAFAPELEQLGYQFVEVREGELEDGLEPVYILHVEKIESHTVESLEERNQELTELAKLHNIDSYDGMDVGPEEGQ